MKKISTGPDDLLFHIQRSDLLFGSHLGKVGDFDLEVLEDLYYAICGKTKDLLDCANIHITNGFTKLDDQYLQFRDPVVDGFIPMTLGDFVTSLLAKESVLYSCEIINPLNRAILEKNMREILVDKPGATNVSPHCYPPQLEPDQDGSTSKGMQLEEKGVDRAKLALKAQGLQDMRKKSCSMIFGELSEKYRPILARERAEREQRENMRALERAQIHREQTFRKLCGESEIKAADSQSDQISADEKARANPHNLTRRLERLSDPNGPEFPCICDPDCLCAPLCAGEPEENCLCETDPLFWRVTSGYEIEELLYRAGDERHLFGSRNNRLAQLMVGGLSSPTTSTFTCAVNSVEAQLTAMEELMLQEREVATAGLDIRTTRNTFTTPPKTPVNSLSIYPSPPTTHAYLERQAHVPEPINPRAEMPSDSLSHHWQHFPPPTFSRKHYLPTLEAEHRTSTKQILSADLTPRNLQREMKSRRGTPATKFMERMPRASVLPPKCWDARTSKSSQVRAETQEGRKRNLPEVDLSFGAFKRPFCQNSRAKVLSSEARFHVPTQPTKDTSDSLDRYISATRGR